MLFKVVVLVFGAMAFANVSVSRIVSMYNALEADLSRPTMAFEDETKMDRLHGTLPICSTPISRCTKRLTTAAILTDLQRSRTRWSTIPMRHAAYRTTLARLEWDGETPRIHRTTAASCSLRILR